MNFLNRRSLLKGVTLGAGAVVLQPVLRSLAAEAAGESAPRRIVFFIEGNGMNPDHIQPQGLERPDKGSDKLINESLANYALPEPIAALAPFKNRLTIIQGLSHKIASGRGHSPEYGSLGCYSGAAGPIEQTIDAALAAKLPSVVPHLGLALTPGADQIVDYSISVASKGKPLPFHCQPELAFQSLFGSAAGGEAAKIPFLRKNLMDYMSADIRRVQSQLAGPERASLDRYLEAYESMLDRHHGIAAMKDALQANMPNPDKFKNPAETDRLEAQCDLAVGALLSGLTNVVTISACGGNKYMQWANLGMSLRTNAIGHGGGENGKTSDDLLRIIRAFHAERIAALAKKLDAVKEGNGTVLDNTLIVYMSDFGDRHHPSYTQWPVVLIGNLGGKLKTNGRYLEYPRYGAPGHRTLGTMYHSLLHAVGDQREQFNNVDLAIDKDATHGPLSEILV
ncbi:DUF1552 domain-containing protein [Lignipirellula cremea]|uniref:DUF1552 domain-containing protein n=1 Tax=Lignipirellula cremea TaxID=2528010 RepID=A0A518DKD5_9BACT|nr:DUF1552 domain-containing protein [Lignipirellula cremea]QDU92290.1 hypothetical protein Pla8534_00350 [Lignipirellula cremea]